MTTLTRTIKDEHSSDAAAAACMSCTELTSERTPCCRGPCCADCFREWLNRSETCMHCRRKLHELPGIDLSNSRDEMIEYIVHTIHELVSEECPICAMERVLGVKEKEEEDVRLEYNQFFRNPKEKRLNL